MPRKKISWKDIKGNRKREERGDPTPANTINTDQRSERAACEAIWALPHLALGSALRAANGPSRPHKTRERLIEIKKTWAIGKWV